MKPYKIIAEDKESITYEYNTSFTWALYGILVILLAGIFTDNNLIQYAGAFLVLIYFAIKITQGTEATTKIKSALQNQSAQLSGTKHSFSSPLTIKIPKNA